MLGSKGTIEDQNPEKLPHIRKKDFNQTGFKEIKSNHKKDLNDLKHELELWIKSYLANNQKDHNNIDDI